MIFRTHRTKAPLDELVADFWLYDAYAQPHARERILPTGTFELVINLREDALRVTRADGEHRFRGAIVSGTFTRPFITDTLQEASMIGVHFKPAGAFAFLGMPAAELRDAHVELADLWGRFAGELRERLCAATHEQRFPILERALRARLVRAPHRAIAPALRTIGRSSVRETASRIGMSERRLSEIFSEEVGMPPKLYARLQRFQRAMKLANAEADWSDVALDSGYYDQAHLIRDFVQFCGLTPAAWLRHRDALLARGVHLKRHHLPL
jgi:AraC-like DNA-binding protein